MTEIARDALLAHLDELLSPALFTDYAPNGVQVEGRPMVRRVVTGVTASLALIEAAAAVKADAIVVHHGIFWDGASPVLRGSLRKRVRALLNADITLFGYHLPLDAHADVGNNAPALRDLGVGDLAPFGLHRGRAIGWRGSLPEPESAAAFTARLERVYGTKPLAFSPAGRMIRTVGLVSGAAQGDAKQAVAAGLDAFITGEVSEYNMHLAAEENFHHFSVGHHASERIGPRCLAAHLTRALGIDATFIDIPNPA